MGRRRLRPRGGLGVTAALVLLGPVALLWALALWAEVSE